MKAARCAVVLVGLLGISGLWAKGAQKAGASAGAANAHAALEGVWRGHSVCEDKNSPCHDEVNVYRFSPVTGRPGIFLVTASKVVDGKEIVMGNGEWKYDEAKKAVESEQPRIQLRIDGKEMEGALRLADGTIYRRIYLTKES